MAQRSEHAKHTASKYDFVKVKVWLGEGMDHYYVLSRFLISRMLTVTKIPYMKAVKIALEVKKYLIDNSYFDVTQASLEAILFDIMECKGFGAEYKKRYKMVNQFHQERRPLIIIVCGAPCTGKSSLAQQLASRFNMPNVLQTDMFYELLRTSNDKPLNGRPLWERSDLNQRQLVHEFQRECHVVRRSIDGDLVKTIRDGKSIIIEGLHLDPGLYLYEFGKYGVRHLHSRSDSLLPNNSGAPDKDSPVLVEPVNPEPMNPDTDVQKAARLEPHNRATQTAAPASQEEPSSNAPRQSLLGSVHQMLLPQPKQQGSAATGMLFALQSVANRMSPVLSSYVSWQPADRLTGTATDSRRNSLDEDSSHSQLARSPGSEWLGQQLQKALHGLTATIAPRALQSSSEPSTNASHQADAAAETKVSANQPKQQAGAAESGRRSVNNSMHHQQQISSSQKAPEPPAAGNHGIQAAVEPQKPHGVSDRVPAAVALESNDHPEQKQHEIATAPNSDAQPASHSETELQQPHTIKQPDSKTDKKSPTPVFVPIVVSMDERDHKLLVDEWYSRHMAVSGQLSNTAVSDQDVIDSANATYSRIRLLQEHLCTYSERNVPVVSINFANFSETLDQLHDYLLQCIESAMQQK